MSTDNFEKLDNASLRVKCLEYGLPNVPITDTSRNILIKKLRAAVGASAGVDDKKTKQRRETIHGTKIPTLKESVTVDEHPKKNSGKANTRRTIAAASAVVDNGNVSKTANDFVPTATANAAPAPAEVLVPAPVTQRRRSGRVTPNIQGTPDTVIPTNKRKTTKILEEEDEDYDEIIEAAERAETTLRTKAIGRDRKSRSSSLTKTSVVSTSYSKEPGPEVIQEAESDSDVEIVNEIYNVKNVPFSNEKLSYVFSQPKEPIFAEPDVISPSLLPSNSNYAESDFFTSQRSADPNISALSYSPLISRSSFESQSYKPYVGESFGKVSSQNTTTRYSTGRIFTPEPKITKRYTTYVENSDDPEDDNTDVAIETPYYSDFARKLEQLKTETFNLNSRGISAKRELSSAPYGSSKNLSRQHVGYKQTFLDSCTNYMIELDEKYKIKRNILIAFLFLLILIILVFVFY